MYKLLLTCLRKSDNYQIILALVTVNVFQKLLEACEGHTDRLRPVRNYLGRWGVDKQQVDETD